MAQAGREGLRQGGGLSRGPEKGIVVLCAGNCKFLCGWSGRRRRELPPTVPRALEISLGLMGPRQCSPQGKTMDLLIVQDDSQEGGFERSKRRGRETIYHSKYSCQRQKTPNQAGAGGLEGEADSRTLQEVKHRAWRWEVEKDGRGAARGASRLTVEMGQHPPTPPSGTPGWGEGREEGGLLWTNGEEDVGPGAHTELDPWVEKAQLGRAVGRWTGRGAGELRSGTGAWGRTHSRQWGPGGREGLERRAKVRH